MEKLELYLIVIIIVILIALVLNTIKYYKGEKRKVKNLHRFAKDGERDAQKDLAKHYEEGYIVKKDTKKAAFWHLKASITEKQISKAPLSNLSREHTKKKK
jgi:TPR repeat protein